MGCLRRGECGLKVARFESGWIGRNGQIILPRLGRPRSVRNADMPQRGAGGIQTAFLWELRLRYSVAAAQSEWPGAKLRRPGNIPVGASGRIPKYRARRDFAEQARAREERVIVRGPDGCPVAHRAMPGYWRPDQSGLPGGAPH